MNTQIEIKNESILKIEDIYFSNFEFENKRKIGPTNLRVTNHVEHVSDENIENVIVTTEILSDKKDFRLFLKTVGKFSLQDKQITEDLKHEILYKNTLAIMFPYIRSEITLLTAQPGLNPILLPALNMNTLADEK